MSRKVLAGVAGLVMVTSIYAQQLPLFTFFSFSGMHVNPAVPGYRPEIKINAIHRQQWVGIEGRPVSSLLQVDAPVGKTKLGIGGVFVSDKAGAFSTNMLKVALAYKYRLGTSVLSFGLGTSLSILSIEGRGLISESQINDLAIPTGKNESVFDVYTGALIRNRKWYAGLSIINLLSSKVPEFGYETEKGLVLLGGSQFRMSSDGDWTMNTNAQYKADFGNASVGQFDVAGFLWFRNQYSIGLNSRIKEAISPLIGYRKKISRGEVQVMYAYDLVLNKLKKATSGSHEVLLQYIVRFGTEEETEGYKNVRFL